MRACGRQLQNGLKKLTLRPTITFLPSDYDDLTGNGGRLWRGRRREGGGGGEETGLGRPRQHRAGAGGPVPVGGWWVSCTGLAVSV